MHKSSNSNPARNPCQPKTIQPKDPPPSKPNHLPSKKTTHQKPYLPHHAEFIYHQARNGEDANSILILFETEFPDVRGVDLGFVQSVLGRRR
jgi:hypothetical protein